MHENHNKRKYAKITHFSSHLSDDFKQYQILSSDACLEKILSIFDNKKTCQKFNDKKCCVPSTHNLVSTAHIKSGISKLDLQTIAGSFANTTYDKKKFAAITIRLSNPKTTALLFSSGKLVITGG
jgi:hypothetical protein